MAGKFKLSVEVDPRSHQELRGFNASRQILRQAAYEAGGHIEQDFRRVITLAFEKAIADAGPAFPAVYAVNLMAHLASHLPRIQLNGITVQIDFDFGVLGRKEDLREGYHFHALLKNGKLSELPYRGAALKNPLEARYAFWLAISSGLSVEGQSNLEVKTYAARVAHWNSRGVAPQWLLLNYGTPYYPQIRPTPLVEIVRGAIARAAPLIFGSYIDAANNKIVGAGVYHKGDASLTNPSFMNFLRVQHLQAEISGVEKQKIEKIGQGAMAQVIAKVMRAKTAEELSQALFEVTTINIVDTFSIIKSLRRPNG